MGMFKEAWARYRLARNRQRELTEAFTAIGVNYMSLDTKLYERLLKEAMINTDAAAVVTKYTPLLHSAMKVSKLRSIARKERFDDAARSELADIVATLELDPLHELDMKIFKSAIHSATPILDDLRKKTWARKQRASTTIYRGAI